MDLILVLTNLNVLHRRHFLKNIFLSMHILPPMNFMLDFIWTLPVKLRGTRNKRKLQKKILFLVEFEPPTAGYPAYKSTVLTSRPISNVVNEEIKCPCNACYKIYKLEQTILTYM